MVGLISSPLMEWSTRLPELAARLKDKLHVFDRPLALWQELRAWSARRHFLAAPFQMPKFEWVQPTLEFLSPTFTEFLLFFATLVLFIASWRDLRRALIMNFGDHEARLRTLRILNEIEEHLGTYLLTVTLINIGVGVGTGIVCAITHMPNPAGLGALAATFNSSDHRPGRDVRGPDGGRRHCISVDRRGLIAPLAFVGIAFLEGHFVTPTIIGRRLELNALAVFMGLAFWTWLWGPMGGFLSSPLLIVALILKEHLFPVHSPQLPHRLTRFRNGNFRAPARWRFKQCQHPEFSMSMTNGETPMSNMTDKATYERLEKDVTTVKSDIAALTEQITEALNSFAGTATKQARRGYKQARANVDATVDDISERGGAMMDAAQDAASSIEETLEDVITQRPLATVAWRWALAF